MTNDESAPTRLQARVSGALADWLTDRNNRCHSGSIHLQAATELATWQAVMAAELHRIHLTLAEAQALTAATAAMPPPRTPGIPLGHLYVATFDAFRRDWTTTDLAGTYAAEYGIDEKALLDRLVALSPAADLALADALTRHAAAHHPSTVEGYATVGLRVAAA